MLAIALKKANLYGTTIGFGIAYLGIAIWFLPHYLTGDTNLYLGLLLLPYTCTVNKEQQSLRYAAPALLVIVLAILLPVKTLFFLALLFAVLLLIESSMGKISNTFFFLLLLISPVFQHITHMGEFSVRFWLTEKVAGTLTFIGISATAAGNQVQLGKYEFSVDPACAGLNMLVISLLLFLFAVAFYQKQYNKQLGFIWLTALFTLTILLNIACNFFRILVLVLFKIMPGTFFHDFVGIVCLILYLMLPLMLFTKPLVNRFGRTRQVNVAKSGAFNTLRYIALHVIMLLAILFISFRLAKADDVVHYASNNIRLSGYKKTNLNGGITKLENKEALIYIKPTAFYAPEHDPMICWTGSGYQFKNIQTKTINGVEVYTATLLKGTDKIYAAWWFDNGTLKTANQIKWRWAAARDNESFCLINVNTATPQNLYIKTTQLLNRSPLH